MKKLSLMIIAAFLVLTIAVASFSRNSVGNSNAVRVDNAANSETKEIIGSVKEVSEKSSNLEGILAGCKMVDENNLTVNELKLHATKFVVKGNLAGNTLKLYGDSDVIIHSNLAVENIELHSSSIVVLGNASIGNLEMYGSNQLVVHGNLTVDSIGHSNGGIISLGNYIVGSSIIEDEETSADGIDTSGRQIERIINGSLSDVEEELKAAKRALILKNEMSKDPAAEKEEKVNPRNRPIPEPPPWKQERKKPFPY